MILRATVVWLVLSVLAILNGTFRQFVLLPRVGEAAGHVVSTVTLSLLIVWVAWLSIGWIAPPTRGAAWLVGGFWLACTLAFEFLAGHYLFRHPWSKLLHDYDVRQGRIWVLVLLATAVAPRIAAALRRFPVAGP